MPQLAINALIPIIIAAGVPSALATGLATLAVYGSACRDAICIPLDTRK